MARPRSSWRPPARLGEAPFTSLRFFPYFNPHFNPLHPLFTSAPWPSSKRSPRSTRSPTDPSPATRPPCACCPRARDATWMQLVAREMNLAETAFLVRARRRVRSALVHADGRGRSVRPRDARERARAVGGRASAPRRHRAFPYPERAPHRRAAGTDSSGSTFPPPRPAAAAAPAGLAEALGAEPIGSVGRTPLRLSWSSSDRRDRGARLAPGPVAARDGFRTPGRDRHGAPSDGADARLREPVLRARGSASPKTRSPARPTARWAPSGRSRLGRTELSGLSGFGARGDGAGPARRATGSTSAVRR